MVTFFAPPDSWAEFPLTIDKAEIVGGDKVKVIGSGADPSVIIFWAVGFDFEPVTVSDRNGKFHFETDLIPFAPECWAEVVDTFPSNEATNVRVEGCESEIIGFYGGAQDIVTVEPGELGTARSFCDAGDWAVSGQFFITTNTNTPADFQMRRFSLLIDGGTGIQSWIGSGWNNGTLDTELRVSVRCADVLPRHQ